MDEKMLQKLLFFTQREAIIRTRQLMFDVVFRAWKYCPVITEIHDRYQAQEQPEELSQESIIRWKECFDNIFTESDKKKTISLISLAHRERSWNRTRKGYGKFDRSDVPMKLSDIFEDAEYRKQRRVSLLLSRAAYSILQQSTPIISEKQNPIA